MDIECISRNQSQCRPIYGIAGSIGDHVEMMSQIYGIEPRFGQTFDSIWLTSLPSSHMLTKLRQVTASESNKKLLCHITSDEISYNNMRSPILCDKS
jgi:hypothetical protein